MQAHNASADRPPVIVRAWGNEPVKLFLYNIVNKRCYVGSQDSETPIGLPLDQGFVFDVDRFSTLSTIFQQGDVDKLGERLANIPLDDLACNRYQDVLSSQNDKENVSDSECASSGNTQ